MSHSVHPNDALFEGEKPFPVIPACEHFAGSEKLILKALELQDKLGPIFDITCDCEDGAPAGREKEHAEMIVRVLNSAANRHKMAGVRIHDPSHGHWKQDVDILVEGAGETHRLHHHPEGDQNQAGRRDDRIYPETRGEERHQARHPDPRADRNPRRAARRPRDRRAAWLQVLDFGLMDFVSGHHGAIPASCMRSPGQFEHRLIARAKGEVVAAALANGVVPAHNVTLDLKNPYAAYQDARRARTEFGFLRKWSIYPTQIQPIVDAMKPDHSEVATGAAILLAAQKADWGPIQHAGELHDRATYRYYWEVLQKARVTGIKLPEEAEQAFFG